MINWRRPCRPYFSLFKWNVSATQTQLWHIQGSSGAGQMSCHEDNWEKVEWRGFGKLLMQFQTHVCSSTFAGTYRSQAGFFTFLSRQPIVDQLRTGGRNWFRTIITTTKNTKSEFYVLSFCNMLSCKHLVFPACKTSNVVGHHVGSELPLTSISVTHLGLVAIRLDMF